ncbi:MAG: NupC/NupG family nucleoside CNT transporter [Gemmataceae bacterium]
MQNATASHVPAGTPKTWRLGILIAVVGLVAFAYTFQSFGSQGRAGVGIVTFFGIGALFSKNLRAVNWRTIFWGIVLQFALAILILKVGYTRNLSAEELQAGQAERAAAMIGTGMTGPVSILPIVAVEPPTTRFVRPVYLAFERVGDGIKAFIGYSDKGAEFVFGNLARPGDIALNPGKEFLFMFAFKALPPILFVSAFFTVLYHYGLLQICVRLLAKVMVYLMGTSGAETLSVAANVFMGQTEAPLIVKPYVPRMTTSELFTLMVSGMAHISGGMMAVYINYGADPVSVLTTCIMACPCSLYLAKLILPEVETPETSGAMAEAHTKSPYVNAVDAAAAGTGDGLRLALNVAAMLIVFVAFVAMFDGLLALIPFEWINHQSWWPTSWHLDAPLSLQWIFGKLFSPVAMLMGVDPADQSKVGSLLGTKLAINEHVAYLRMKTEYLPKHLMSDRSFKLAAFALTGFANFASIGIQLGGIGAMAPDRRHDLARLGGKALFGGFLATLLNASLAGILIAE